MISLYGHWQTNGGYDTMEPGHSLDHLKSSKVDHGWFYLGWVLSVCVCIPPKKERGGKSIIYLTESVNKVGLCVFIIRLVLDKDLTDFKSNETHHISRKKRGEESVFSLEDNGG